MLNKDDGTITFILQMVVAPKTNDVESWISERSSRVTFEFEEMKTRRFEWFLSTDKTKATLIEVFDDSEGALTRFNNLISSTNENYTEDIILMWTFTVGQFIVSTKNIGADNWILHILSTHLTLNNEMLQHKLIKTFWSLLEQDLVKQEPLFIVLHT